MISVKQAEKIVLDTIRSFGTEHVDFDSSISRILAEDVLSDRDVPPFDRVAMDGIAIDHQAFLNGKRVFQVETVGPAGEEQKTLRSSENCIEIMTGAPLPKGTNTVIRYEDLKALHNTFEVEIEVERNKNIHYQGSDLQQGAVILRKNREIKAIDVNVLASVGKSSVSCYKNPRIALISSGNELVEVDEQPKDYQIRKSNVYMIKSRLLQLGIEAELFHFKDDSKDIYDSIEQLESEFDVLILSGGVSKGKFDFIPPVLDQLGYEKLFHRVAQRPGKPFWFGTKNQVVVFAFPGNPVSTLMCFHRYFIPWLRKCMHQPQLQARAKLAEDIIFKKPLSYFAQARIEFDQSGELIAQTGRGNGSGDLVHPTNYHGFLELPAENEIHRRGEAFPFIPFYPIL